jgi:hypothetical protein
MDNEQLTTKELQNRIIRAQAILKVTDKLDEAKVPYTIHECLGGYQLRFPWCDGDIVAHQYAPSKLGKVESMDFSWDAGDVTVMEPEAMGIMVEAEYIIHEIMER